MVRTTTRLVGVLIIWLFIGALLNIAVALACDWHANTVPRPMVAALPEAAKVHGWTGELPADAQESVVVWRNLWPGASLFVVMVGSAQGIEVSPSGETITVDTGPTMRRLGGMMFHSVETQAGWPMRSLVTRGSVGRRGAAARAGMPHLSLSISFDGPITMGRLPAGADGRIDVLPDRGEVPRVADRADAGAAVLQPSPDQLQVQFSGRLTMGTVRTTPTTPLASSPWSIDAVSQLVDPARRAWPLPLTPMWRGFLFNTVLYAALLWVAMRSLRAIRRTSRSLRGLCACCAFDLRGGEHGRCPECGSPVSRWVRRASAPLLDA